MKNYQWLPDLYPLGIFYDGKFVGVMTHDGQHLIGKEARKEKVYTFVTIPREKNQTGGGK